MWPNAEDSNNIGSTDTVADSEVERRARLCQLRNLPPIPRVNLEPTLSKARLPD